MRCLIALIGAAAAVAVAVEKGAGAAHETHQKLVEVELNVTSHLIQAYQRRLAVLQQLKDRVDSGEEIPSDLFNALTDTSVSLQMPAVCGACGPAGPVAFRPRQKAFGDFFVPRHSVPELALSCLDLIPIRVRAASRVSKKDTSMGFAASATFLTVGGSTDGLLRFFDSAGSLIHTEPLASSAGTQPTVATHVLYGKLDSRPFVAVATDSGRVLVFELNVWAYGKLLLGDRRVHKRAEAEAALNETAAVKAARATVQLSASTPASAGPAELLAAQGTEFAVLLNLTAEVDLEGGVAAFFAQDGGAEDAVVAANGDVAAADSGSSSADPQAATAASSKRNITSMEIFAYQGKRLIIVGDSSGCISVLSSDGVFEHVFIPRPAALATAETMSGDGDSDNGPAKIARTVRPAPVTALAKGTNVLAYSMKKVIGFISVSRQVFQAHMCHATDEVVSLAFDSMARSMLWAGTRSGDVLVFHTRYKLKTGSGQTECKLQHRISADSHTPFPAVVRSLRGHLLVANGNSLRAFNSSRVQREPPHLLAQARLGNTSAAGALLATAIGPVGSDQESEMRVSFFDAGEQRLHGFEALLSIKRESSSDFNWFRIPILFVGIAAFVVYQVYRSKRNDGHDHDTTMRALAGALKRDPGGFKGRGGHHFPASGSKAEIDNLIERLAQNAGQGLDLGGAGSSMRAPARRSNFNSMFNTDSVDSMGGGAAAGVGLDMLREMNFADDVE